MNVARIFCIILSLFFSTLVSCQSKANQLQEKQLYWESFTESQKEKVLESEQGNKSVIKLYRGEFVLKDDEATISLLDTLINIKKGHSALRFYLFNRICNESDGALSEILGCYCQKIILQDPLFVFTYLSKNPLLLKKYTQYLGYELYFEEDGSSVIRYGYDEFKELITRNLEGEKELKETLNSFFEGIKTIMKNMD